MLRWRLSAEPTALIARGRPSRAAHAAVGHRRRRPLHTAAEFGSYDVVRMLLQEHGVDTLAPCGRYDNETGVYIARRSGCRTIARLLTPRSSSPKRNFSSRVRASRCSSDPNGLAAP